MEQGSVHRIQSPVQQNEYNKSNSHCSVLGNRHCARELMFGRAPLSISGKVRENPSDVSTNTVNKTDMAIDRKRKYDSPLENEFTSSEVCHGRPLPELPRPVIKIVDNAIQTEDNEQSRESGGKLVFLESVPSSKIASLHRLQDKHAQDNTGAVNFHNNTCLQADWSLPCFRTVENQVSSTDFIGDKVPKKTHQQQDVYHLEQNAIKSEEGTKDDQSKLGRLSENASSKEATFPSGKPVAPGWNDSTKSSSEHSRFPTLKSPQQSPQKAHSSLFQSLQLESHEGEIMIVPSNDQSDRYILLPQLSEANHTEQQMAPAVSAGHNHGMVLNCLHRQPENNSIQLNSSGEELEHCSDTRDNLSPHRPPYPSMLQKQVERAKQNLQIDSPFFGKPDDNDPGRQQHNHKERIRRARIRDACHLMRQLVPGMSDKTDKATVFEFAARYVHFLRTFVGEQYDKDFLLKYSPY